MQLINRPRYVARALLFADTDLVKVVTGIRRCGKSSLLQLVADHFVRKGVDARSITMLNLESRRVRISTEQDLYDYVRSRVSADRRSYVFIDEVQKVPGWENAVNALRVDFDCDLYVTGSNAYVLSSNLSTYISGRYVEIPMLPLSFDEYLSFLSLRPSANPLQRSLLFDSQGTPYATQDVFQRYLQYGGMPALAHVEVTQEQHEAYMASLYDSILTRDIMMRSNGTSYRNRSLLERLTSFLADSIGNPLSVNRITGTLNAERERTSNKTVDAYLSALVAAYIFYPVRRFDVKGRELLKTLGKLYIADSGLRSWIFRYRQTDTGRVLENVVYLHLKAWGWSVHVGKVFDREVDFIAIKEGRTVYIQVTETLDDEATRRRELASLRAIGDSTEKIVVVGHLYGQQEVEGIRIVPAELFLLGDIL